MMPLGTVLTLVVSIARAFGLVAEDVLAFSRQERPELRAEHLPDAAGDMYEARASAQLRALREVLTRQLAAGNIRGSSYRELVAAAPSLKPEVRS